MNSKIAGYGSGESSMTVKKHKDMVLCDGCGRDTFPTASGYCNRCYIQGATPQVTEQGGRPNTERPPDRLHEYFYDEDLEKEEEQEK